MSNIWFFSDPHFSHKNTLRYCGRPFFTVKQCDDTMIRNINAVVMPEDTLYVVGDVAMHTAPIKRLIPQIKCKNIILVVGNHDLMYDYFIMTRGQKFVDRIVEEYKAAGFKKIIHGQTMTHINGTVHGTQWVRICHFPTKSAAKTYHGDKHDHARPVDDGTLNICGHVHQLFVKRGNDINVGVDAWDFKPVSADTLIDLYRNGPTNVETPKKWRIAIWKIYHTAVWKISKLFERKKK
jgi:calcineurin-like phosphoesterase family protein